MFEIERDGLGSFTKVSCKCCGKDVRVSVTQDELESWNEDLLEGSGSGLCTLLETKCDNCKQHERMLEDYFEKKGDASYQALVYEKVYYA